MLTAKAGETDKIVGLEMGADDQTFQYEGVYNTHQGSTRSGIMTRPGRIIYSKKLPVGSLISNSVPSPGSLFNNSLIKDFKQSILSEFFPDVESR